MSKQIYYEYLKKEIDEMSYIQQYILLKKTGLIFKGLCPFHKEKTPSFAIYPPGYKNHNEEQKFLSFYCFGCGKAGDIIKFNQYLNNLETYYESAIDLAKQFNLKLDDSSEVQNEYLKDLKNNLNQVQMLSLEEINLTCSQMIKSVSKNPEKLYKFLDEELDNRSTIEAQSLIKEIKQKIKEEFT